MRIKIVISIFLSILIGGFAYKIYKLKSASSVSPTGRINVLFYSEKGDSWVLALKGGEIRGVIVPANLYIESARGAGSYKVGKLAELGQLEKEKLSFVRDSFVRFLKVPIDATVLLNNKTGTDKKPGGLISYKFIFGADGVETDLGLWDRFLLWRRLSSSVAVKRDLIDLSKTSAVLKEKQPDQYEIYKVESDLLPIKAQQIFVEKELAEEKETVVVYNTTGASGLAEIAAKIIENSGIDVLQQKNYDPIGEECLIYAQKPKSLSVKRVTQIFDCKVEKKMSYGLGTIEVYLGDEFKKRMFGK